MPIRTNRGRAAVYRRLWGWPLRSPNHLIATIVGFAVLVFVLSFVVPNVGKRSSAAGPLTGAAGSSAPGQVGVLPSGVPSISLPTKAAPPSPNPPSAAVDPNAQLTAENWAEAWSTHPAGITNEQWLAKLKPYTTEEKLPTMSSVDPANLPDGGLTGTVKARESHAESAVFEVGLKAGGKLVMTLVKRDGEWRVHEYGRE
jgi:hypothetical protein